MLSAQNKKKLRTIAMSKPSMVQIGKGNLSDALFATISDDLEAHELVKVTMQKTSEISVREAAIECASQTGSEIVQIIGRTFVLYRRNPDKKTGLLA